MHSAVGLVGCWRAVFCFRGRVSPVENQAFTGGNTHLNLSLVSLTLFFGVLFLRGQQCGVYGRLLFIQSKQLEDETLKVASPYSE